MGNEHSEMEVSDPTFLIKDLAGFFRNTLFTEELVFNKTPPIYLQMIQKVKQCKILKEQRNIMGWKNDYFFVFLSE